MNAVKQQAENLGKQPGQRRKVKNVLLALRDSLKSSVGYLLMRQNMKLDNGYGDKEIKTIAEHIVELRSQLSHDTTIITFDEKQNEVAFLSHRTVVRTK